MTDLGQVLCLRYRRPIVHFIVLQRIAIVLYCANYRFRKTIERRACMIVGKMK